MNQPSRPEPQRLCVCLARVLLLGLCLPLMVLAQPARTIEGDPDTGDLSLYVDIDIQLLTIGPGPTYWERFGHNTLIVSNRISGRSDSYNYGMFDFGQANFMLNFLRGRMMYRMETYTADNDLQYYQQQNRSMQLQTLNLSPAQKKSLIDFTEWNRQPENAAYRYRYFTANCSTRLRDVIDWTLSGSLRQTFEPQVAPETIRESVRRYASTIPWMLAGTMLGLGQSSDEPLSRWGHFYLPEELMLGLRELTAEHDGRPLVSEDISLSVDPIQTPTIHYGLLILIGLGIGVTLAAMLWLLSRSERSARWWLMGLHGLLGLTSLCLLGLWVLTEHIDAYWNENLLLFSPLSLWVMGSLWRHQFSRALSVRVAWLLLLPASIGLGLHLIPSMGQQNAEVIALILPLHLMTLGLIRRFSATQNSA